MTADIAITTPAELNGAVRAYAATLGDGEAEFVPVRPETGALEAQPFHNVILAGAGTPVFGWLIWELTGCWLEAQRHAVVARDGALVDITPPIDAETRIVFVRDRGWSFDYLDPKPVRRAPRHLLTDAGDVRDWAALADEVDAFTWRNTRFRDRRSELVLAPGKDTRRMERLQRDYNAAARRALGRLRS